jgi:hypothetical protein
MTTPTPKNKPKKEPFDVQKFKLTLIKYLAYIINGLIVAALAYGLFWYIEGLYQSGSTRVKKHKPGEAGSAQPYFDFKQKPQQHKPEQGAVFSV